MAAVQGILVEELREQHVARAQVLRAVVQQLVAELSEMEDLATAKQQQKVFQQVIARVRKVVAKFVNHDDGHYGRTLQPPGRAMPYLKRAAKYTGKIKKYYDPLPRLSGCQQTPRSRRKWLDEICKSTSRRRSNCGSFKAACRSIWTKRVLWKRCVRPGVQPRKWRRSSKLRRADDE